MSRPPHTNELETLPIGKRCLVHAPTSPLRGVIASLDRVAKSRAPVLVTGESGTGKEGIVRLIHDLAPWSSGPFVPVNCGAIPTTLLESELFGHVRGAFTGADRNRVGRFEAASGGTLFLDEIGETPLELQVKLLRVLQDRVFVPVGGSTPKSADVRVIAATNIDVTHAVREGRFREDLFFRLDVIRIELPPLRARPMDIEPLARHFIAAHAGPNQSKVDDITPEALAELRRHTWPGNVRELENVIQGILVLKESGAIEAGDIRHKLGLRGRDTSRALELRGPAASHFDLGPIDSMLDDEGPTNSRHASTPSAIATPAAGPEIRTLNTIESLRLSLPEEGLALKDTLERLERELINEALTRAKGNRARAASLLGLNRTTLVEKLRRMPIGKLADLDERASLHPVGELRADHLEH